MHLAALNVVIHARASVSRMSRAISLPITGSDTRRVQYRLLHTCLDGDSRHYAYAPTTTTALVAKGYQYWALGHVHQRRVLQQDGVPIVFPGNLQGRRLLETGPKAANS